MRRIAFFQPFSGISGDMTLGGLVDAGLDLGELERELRGLPLGGYRLEAEKVHRGAIEATRLRVVIASHPADAAARRAPEGEAEGSPRPSPSHPDDAHAHSHAHTHSHAHSHSHSPPHPHVVAENRGGAPPHRSLRDILELIEASRLPERVQRDATAVFRRLGSAEAHVHGMPIEDVHFHEVGAVDSIVDIVGSCLALHLLGIDEVHAAPIHVGTGWVTGSHGRLPLPAPATLELLRGFPVRQVDSGAELTTPTGAALLTTLARSFGTLPHATIRSIGYGAGDDRPGLVPNCLRVIIAERPSSATERDRVVLLETNIDDMSAEWLGHLVERRLAVGALDVSLAPILMKKSRPAHQVSVIAPFDREERVAAELFRESTTFGVRRTEVDRLVLEREQVTVPTPWGDVRVKLGRLGGDEVTASPEFDDLRRASEAGRRPLKEVHELVLREFRARRG